MTRWAAPLFCCLLTTFCCADTNTEIQRVVEQLQKWKDVSLKQDKPFVTASFAQSLDGKLAVYDEQGKLSSNYPISGEESLILTHACRSIHDGILIGVETLKIDNPRLSNRLWGERQPRPIILDTHLAFRLIYDNMRAKDPILCCSERAAESHPDVCSQFSVLPCRCDNQGNLDLRSVIDNLRKVFGIQSIMVEGGPTILGSFLEQGLVDCVCITIAPLLLGDGKGLKLNDKLNQLREVQWTQLDSDICLIACT